VIFPVRSYFRRSRLAVMQEPSCYAATLAATGPSHDAAWVRLDGEGGGLGCECPTY